MCREHDQCTCEPYYTGADCSQRVCPFDFAFVDIPAGDLNHDGLLTSDTYVSFSDGFSSLNAFPAYELFPSDATKGLFAAQDGEGHFYMECSGQGDCDRGTGECQCYPGYTGSGCRRSEYRPPAAHHPSTGILTAVSSRSPTPSPLQLRAPTTAAATVCAGH